MHIITTSRKAGGGLGGRLAWERKGGGNHKDKQQLRLGGKRVAAGACIIVEKDECRRTFFFLFFFFLFFCLGNLDPQFLWVPGTATQNPWNECKECIVWEPHRSVVTFFSALASGRWGMKATGNGGKCRRLFLSVSL